MPPPPETTDPWGEVWAQKWVPDELSGCGGGGGLQPMCITHFLTQIFPERALLCVSGDKNGARSQRSRGVCVTGQETGRQPALASFLSGERGLGHHPVGWAPCLECRHRTCADNHV